MGAFERIKEEFGGYSDASASKNNHWLAVMECCAGGRGEGGLMERMNLRARL